MAVTQKQYERIERLCDDLTDSLYYVDPVTHRVRTDEDQLAAFFSKLSDKELSMTFDYKEWEYGIELAEAAIYDSEIVSRKLDCEGDVMMIFMPGGGQSCLPVLHDVVKTLHQEIERRKTKPVLSFKGATVETGKVN
jgi:hypothetical protein